MEQKKHSADEGKQTGPHTVPSSEVGRGAGLDPESSPPDNDGDPRDEAYAKRPSQKDEPSGTETDGAGIQRPPADS
jgi:hypothetical protein